MTRKQHATRIVGALSPELRAELQRAPLVAMTTEGLVVRAVRALSSSRGAGGMCDGMSFSEHGTVLYAPTDSRRQNFTLLHEYAHLLVENDDQAMIWLADREDPKTELERLCDDIAAGLLIPEELLTSIVGTPPITGQHLLDLFVASEASQIVCAIALARRLTCTGAVLLTDRLSNTVVHAALVGEPGVYPASRQPVPSDHPLARIRPRQQIITKSFWSTPWGTRSYYYLNATATEKRTYSVLAEVDLWGLSNLHLDTPELPSSTRTTRTITCSCGYSGNAAGFPCTECGKPFCPRCQRCDCERRASLTDRCTICFVSVPRRDLVEGICSNCR
ncbi:ImmA/IrrE family metallo-endopeptidase [Rhodococcus opacus]|uniref:ImmA/IrrE family metallo-endopeptidase n=1 Tax=Rhodococcus opacus TaxID=37919 RepID=UPI000AAEFA66|nr:ImmA/IrrE family metallo-endopeptidase [Rhodococcus opacus]MDX5970205.1 ImmA/IrrE family metallo-endopeptidase [Rhodococcus opacus]NKY75128.1 ImmA/IrrE family metallo-endopeptidase [Rhodococcus opacus]CAG7632568.1 hypothetical protein E143388_07413 [Rhodococcus opacus]